MNRNISIIDFVTDPQLLGLGISKPQETLLRSIYGLSITRSMLEIWQQCTGREIYPRHGFSESTVICGARSGKDSRIATPIAAFEAALGNHEQYLAKGERAVIPLVAQDTRGTKIAFGYLRSYFTDSPLLKSMLEDEPLSNEIRLKNRTSIMCFPSTQSSLRGWSMPVGIMDELGFWRLEGSVDCDTEIQTSIRRGMINFDRTKLIKISSPYMKSGVLHEDFKNHFGQDSPDVLVWRAPSTVMNPSLKESRLERERRLDPHRFAREYLAEFAEDLDSFLPSLWVDQAVMQGRHELAPAPGKPYAAGCDATGLGSGPGADAFTLSVGHYEEGIFVQDCCRGWKKSRTSNLNLEVIVNEIAEILKRYGLREVHGDRYSGQWVVEAFQKAEILYRQTEQDKSVFYIGLEPLFAQGKIEILDHAELSRELRLLERRPRPGGKVIIDHPRGSHDDFANSLAISCAAAARQSFIMPVALGERLINRARDFIDQEIPSGSSINESWDDGSLFRRYGW
jgi:hypothetical protein